MTTDTSTPSPTPAPAPANTGDLSPERLAQARERWVSYGLDGAAFDRGMAGEPEPPPPQRQSPALAGNADFSNEQVRRAVATLSRAGVNPEKIREALIADGLLPDGGALPADVEDLRSDDEKDFDASFGPPVDPSGYVVNWRDVPEATGLPMDQLAALDAGIRGALHAMAFPPKAASVMEQVFQDAKEYLRLDDTGRQQYSKAQRFELARLVAPRDVAEVLADASAMLERFQQADPDFYSALVNNGCFGSARVAVQLALNMDRVRQREAMARTRGAQ